MFVALKADTVEEVAAIQCFEEKRIQALEVLAEVEIFGVSYYFMEASPNYELAMVSKQHVHLVWQKESCPKNFMEGLPLPGYTWYLASKFDVIGTEMTNRGTSSLLKR